MPTIITRGAGSAQGLGYASSSAAVTYIEDVFSTYLYTGTGANQTITNGIDLSGKGGLTWIKSRTTAFNHTLVDTVRGATNLLVSNTTAAQATQANSLTAFTSTGFSIGAGSIVNYLADNIVSWTFREQPKFFDIVTWTGNSVAGRSIAHNLGSLPGCIIVKATSVAGQDWLVYHRSLSTNGYLLLNSTGAESVYPYVYNPTTTTFDVASSVATNGSGTTYVAYLFAHDAGGFGLTGTDNVISCGSYTTVSNAATINLGYEPQLILHKKSDGVGHWEINDNMRGLTVAGSVEARLFPNLSDAESDTNLFGVTSTGFTSQQASATYIYIAIRRGPMKVPTSGTSVFSPIYSAAAANTVLTTSFPVDLQIPAYTGATIGRFVVDRLRGVVTTAVDAATSPWMKTNATDAETTGFNITRAWDNTGYQIPQYLGGATTVYFNFRRAPGFFDEVCWTGTSADQTLTHNLQATPELIIYKARGATSNWYTACAFTSSNYSNLQLNLTSASSTVAYSGGGPFSAQPTSTQFSVGQFYNTSTMVAYLFATLAGVSKVGSYTGNGTTQTINCGFTAGARFVMIKRTDSTGDWYVWDSARGIVAGDDPYLLLNSTAAEVTNTDYVDTAASGFEISSTAPAAINANGGSFIFLSIA